MAKLSIRNMLAGASLFAMTLAAGAVNAQPVTVSLLVDNSPEVLARFEALVAGFEAASPDVNIEIETRPGGEEGGNLVKTRLATGTITDLFTYNSGSLLRALNPGQFMADLSNEPWQADVQETFKSVVSTPEGAIVGAPFSTASAGGILYNKPVYERLGLSIPKTWDEFLANNEVILKDGKVAPIIQTYKDSWTSQILVLADFYNVQAAEPEFATLYTEGKAKFATTAAALHSFQKLEQVFKAGLFNKDFASAGYQDGIRMLATGEGAHYPIISGALRAMGATYPDQLKDIGYFPVPSDDASRNGLTAWMPQALYVSKNTPNLDAAKKFLAFVVSPEGCEILKSTGGGTGPFLVKGCVLENAAPAVSDMLPFWDSGNNSPALEFLSPIKGPALEQITVSVGSGIMTAEEGAKLYDEDVRKQAQQLGLAGW